MDDLQKYEAVNKCVTFEELAKVIESFADEDGMIQGRTRKFSATKMANFARNFSIFQPNVLTRNWGIRQQAMHITYFNEQP